MASIYVKADNTAWVATGVIGPQTLETKGAEAIIHFGTTPPVAYEDGPHHHLNAGDVPFYYAGAEQSFVRAFNDNVPGITQTVKIVVTNG